MKKLIIWAIVLGGAAYGGSKFYLHSEVEKSVDAAVRMMAPFAVIEYDGISSTLSGELTIDDVRVQIVGYSDPLFIDRFGINTPSYFSLLKLSDIAKSRSANGAELPDYFGLIAEGVRSRVNADYNKKLYTAFTEGLGIADAEAPAAECVGKHGYSPKALTAMGYDEDNSSLAITARNGTGSFMVDINFRTEDMWAVDANVVMEGDMMSEIRKGRSYVPRMRSMAATITDLSIIERSEEYCARLGLTPEDIRVAQLDALNYVGESNGIVFDEYVIEPYKEYLDSRSSITFTAKPNEPISLSQIDLYKPSDVPALLNLSATVP